MIPIDTIRSETVSGLSDALGIEWFELHTPGDPPPLPYGTYDFAAVLYKTTGSPVKAAGDDTVTLRETVEFSVDFQFCAEVRGDALILALQARDWFIGEGSDRLQSGPAGTVVVSVEQMTNRDTKEEDEGWRYAYGFSVRFRTASTIVIANQSTIETATIREVDSIG